jgi:hypothetical protein
MVEAGNVSFSVKVDSEMTFDGLSILVDREITSVPFISHSSSFQLYSFELPAGYHFIQFIYRKDNSLSVGLDQASMNVRSFFLLLKPGRCSSRKTVP